MSGTDWGNPIGDTFMARFAGHKEPLLDILRDACEDGTTFDADEAWRMLELVAFSISVSLLPRRPREEVLAEGRKRLQPVLSREPQDKKWARDVARELKQITEAFDKQPHGRPKTGADLLTAIAYLWTVYRNVTGTEPRGGKYLYPNGVGEIGVRAHTKFTELVKQFLIAAGRKPLRADRIHQLTVEVRETIS